MAPRLFIKFLSKAIYSSNIKPSTYATCYLFELCQIVVTLFERCISYSHDQDHVHSTYFTNFYTVSWASISQKHKSSMLFIATLSNLKGHGPVKKMDTWRSKVFKRKRGEKEIWTHEGPMYFKRKLAHVQKK